MKGRTTGNCLFGVHDLAFQKNCAYFVPIAPIFFKKTLTFPNLKSNKKANEIKIVIEIIGFMNLAYFLFIPHLIINV